MHQGIVSGRDKEQRREFFPAFGDYRSAFEAGDADDRYEGALGMLRIYEMGEAPSHPLKWLGIVMLILAALGGLLLIVPALGKGSAGVDAMRMGFGVAATMSGVIWSALLIGAARLLCLVEMMNLRQFVEREARVRGEAGRYIPRTLSGAGT